MSDDLFDTIVSHGIALARATPDAEQWTGRCPFGNHPETVDMHERGRVLAFQPDSPIHPSWRFVAPAPRVAFNVRADRGTWHCFGCGRGGGVAEFLTDWENRT